MRHVLFFTDGKKDIVVSAHNKRYKAEEAMDKADRRNPRYHGAKRGFHFIAEVQP